MAKINIVEFHSINNANKSELNLSSPIITHAKIINSFYQIPYKSTCSAEINRPFHGAQHVNRVSLYIPAIINFRIRHGDTLACALTDTDLKILQLLALFHDSGREGDGKDLWDNDSAINFYHYATIVLKIPQLEAKYYAEVIANKEFNAKSTVYNELDIETGTWNTIKDPLKIQKYAENVRLTTHVKILHDADSLDIIRARTFFGIQYLHIYQDIATTKPLALDELAELICDVRSVIATQGDNKNNPVIAIKKTYELSEDCYSKSEQDLELRHVLKQLYNRGTVATLPTIVPLHPLLDISKPLFDITNPLMNALRDGKLFARGIPRPADMIKRVSIKTNNIKTDPAADIEFKKIARNNEKKQGNKNRSISMIGHGATIFTKANAGFILQGPLEIVEVNTHNVLTGYGKKQNFQSSLAPKSAVDIERDLTALYDLVKKYGEIPTKDESRPLYNEVIAHIKNNDVKYIFYNNDKNFRWKTVPHTNVAIIEAVHLQIVARRHLGKELPIVEYSATHNFIKEIANFSDDQIIKLWSDLIGDYLQNELRMNNTQIATLTIHQIKYEATRYGKEKNNALPTYHDNIYSDELRKKLNERLNEIINYYREEKYASHFIELVRLGKFAITSAEICQMVNTCNKLGVSLPQLFKNKLDLELNIFDPMAIMEDITEVGIIPQYHYDKFFSMPTSDPSLISMNRYNYGFDIIDTHLSFMKSISNPNLLAVYKDNNLLGHEALRLFLLAKDLQNMGAQAKLKEWARKRVNSYFKNTENKQFQPSDVINLESLTVLCAIFEIHAEYKEKITEYRNNFVEKVVTQEINEESFGHILRLNYCGNDIKNTDFLRWLDTSFLYIKNASPRVTINIWAMLEQILKIADLVKCSNDELIPKIQTAIDIATLRKSVIRIKSIEIVLNHPAARNLQINWIHVLTNLDCLDKDIPIDIAFIARGESITFVIENAMKSLIILQQYVPSQRFDAYQLHVITDKLNGLKISLPLKPKTIQKCDKEWQDAINKFNEEFVNTTTTASTSMSGSSLLFFNSKSPKVRLESMNEAPQIEIKH